MTDTEKKMLEMTLRELITEQSEGEWDEVTIEKDVKKFLTKLIKVVSYFD